MGAVYRARQEAVGRDVALKIVKAERAYDPETRVRFEREARATSALVSPHTITVFDFGASEDGSWFLAMELLDGETLGDRLRRVGRLSVADAVRVAHEAASSLAEAHGKGIIHRDLKPDNLFLARQPEGASGDSVKVLDFGIAKLVRGEDEAVDQLETQAGTVFGTPRYMSPEQAQGSQLDARTDLYSLGVILYQMLAGRPPFIDDDAVVVMARHIKEPPPPFAEVAPDVNVPEALERVLRRALAKRPEDRQASAQQLAAELDGALLVSSVVATGTHSTWAASPPSARTRPSRTALALGVFAALALLSGGGFLMVRSLTSDSRAGVAVGSSSVPAAPLPSVALTTGSEPPHAPDPGADASASAGPESSAPAASGGAARRKPKHIPPFVPQKAPAKPDSPYGRFE
jgi:serine/threonine-protein kinase